MPWPTLKMHWPFAAKIAEGLVISVKTVGNHVSNILNKTSVANRTEAATYAGRHGLL